MSKRKQSIGVASIGALVLWATALHGGLLQAGDASASSGGDTIEVPADHATIQEAVDAAQPGDLILVSAGVYHEAVNVQVENLTIRGLDRNEVILDGEFELDNGIRVLGAGGVAIENMTAINYTANGFFWTGVDGYRGSYLTTTRIGLYGIYAFDSINGQLDHSYASGSGDAGFYIGQCYPCNAVMTTWSPSTTASDSRARTPAVRSTSSTRGSTTTGSASSPTRAATSCATHSATSSSPATSCTPTTRTTRRRSATRSCRWATGSSSPAASGTRWSATGCGITPGPVSGSCRTSSRHRSTTSRPRRNGTGRARRPSRTR